MCPSLSLSLSFWVWNVKSEIAFSNDSGKFFTNVINSGTPNTYLSSSIFKKLKSGSRECHSFTIGNDMSSRTQDSNYLSYFNAHFPVGWAGGEEPVLGLIAYIAPLSNAHSVHRQQLAIAVPYLMCTNEFTGLMVQRGILLCKIMTRRLSV